MPGLPAWAQAPQSPPSPLKLVLIPAQGRGPLGLCPGGMGRREAECPCDPAEIPASLPGPPRSAAAAGGGGAREKWPAGTGWRGRGDLPKVEGAQSARARVQSLAPGV